jgi:hypothetical protein
MPLPFQRTAWLPAISLVGAASGCFSLPPTVDSPIGDTEAASPSPAKLYVDTMNRAQQAYYPDWNSFASELEDLGVDIPAETDDYRYEVQSVEPERVVNVAIAKGNGRSVIGAVYVVGDTTQAIVCEAQAPGNVELSAPTLEGDTLTCPSGTRKI